MDLAPYENDRNDTETNKRRSEEGEIRQEKRKNVNERDQLHSENYIYWRYFC